MPDRYAAQDDQGEWMVTVQARICWSSWISRCICHQSGGLGGCGASLVQGVCGFRKELVPRFPAFPYYIDEGDMVSANRVRRSTCFTSAHGQQVRGKAHYSCRPHACHRTVYCDPIFLVP